MGVSQRLQTAMKVYKRRRIGTSSAVEQGVPFGGKKAKLETSKAHVSFDDVTNEDDSNYDGEPLDGVPVKRSCASFDGIVYDDSDDDSDEYPENDYELLLSKGVKRSGSRKRNAPEVYYIYVGTDRCTELQCADLLKEMGCEGRFIACSIEHPNLFFALLNKDEAAKLKGVNGVSATYARSILVDDLD